MNYERPEGVSDTGDQELGGPAFRPAQRLRLVFIQRAGIP
jgi:hypothetical protein